MSTPESLSIIRTLAASAPCDFDNRVKAIEAVQHIEKEFSVLSALRTALEKKPDPAPVNPQS